MTIHSRKLGYDIPALANRTVASGNGDSPDLNFELDLNLDNEQVQFQTFRSFGMNLENPLERGVFHDNEPIDFTKDENQRFIPSIVDVLISSLEIASKEKVSSNGVPREVKQIERFKKIIHGARKIAVNQILSKTTGNGKELDKAVLKREIETKVDAAIQSVSQSYLSSVFRSMGRINQIDFFGDIEPHIKKIHPEAKRRHITFDATHKVKVVDADLIDKYDLFEMGIDFLREDLKPALKSFIEAKLNEKLRDFVSGANLADNELRRAYIDLRFGKDKDIKNKYDAYNADVKLMIADIANEHFSPFLFSTLHAMNPLNPEISILLNKGNLVSQDKDENLTATELKERSQVALSLHETGLLSVATGVFVDPIQHGIRLVQDDLETIIRNLVTKPTFDFYNVLFGENSSKPKEPQKVMANPKSKKLELNLADTDTHIPENQKPTTEYKKQRINISLLNTDKVYDEIKDLFRETCLEIVEKEGKVVDEISRLEKGEKRKSTKKLAKYATALAVTFTTLTVPTGLAVHSTRARRVNELELAKVKAENNLRTKKIQHLGLLIKSSTKIDIEDYIKIATAEMDKIKKEAKKNSRNIYDENDFYFNELYLDTLEAYLLVPPSDKVLTDEIRFFLEHKEMFLGKGGVLDLKVEELLNGFIEGKIDRNKLADELLDLPSAERAPLPRPIRGLETLRAIETHHRKLSGIPSDLLKSKVPDDLRDLFSDTEYYLLYHLVDVQNHPTISELFGSGTLIQRAKSELFNLLQTSEGTKYYNHFNNKGLLDTIRNKVRGTRERLEPRMEALVEELKNSDEIIKLSELEAKLEFKSDPEAAEKEIILFIQRLNKKKEELFPVLLAYARCLVRINELDREINLKMNKFAKG